MKTGVSSDYAYLDTSALEFYYGYEFGYALASEGNLPRPDSEEWGFYAKQDGKIVTSYPFKSLELPEAERFECGECLLRGIGKMIENGVLRLHGGTSKEVEG